MLTFLGILAGVFVANMLSNVATLFIVGKLQEKEQEKKIQEFIEFTEKQKERMRKYAEMES